MRTFLLATICFVSVAAGAQEKIDKDDLKRLKDRMIGSFDNNEQAANDNSYQNIVLHVSEFDLKQKFDLRKKKTKEPDGYWLYVEQALASSPSDPYRQRVYQVYRQDETTIAAKVYELPEPLRFTGAWSEIDMLKKFTRDSLIERAGCTLYFQMNDEGNFTGRTDGKGCESTLEGASYSTTELGIYPNMAVLWERGYDNGDQQVWGAEKAGYRFRKWVQLRKPKD